MALLAASSAPWFSAPATADTGRGRATVEIPADASSIGWPWRGRLRRGVRLEVSVSADPGAAVKGSAGAVLAGTRGIGAEGQDVSDAVVVERPSGATAPALRQSPHAHGRDHLWGTPELVRALERASAAVVAQHGNGVLSVGDLSQEQGGPLAGHRSHRNGRDADLGFYLLDGATGVPALVDRFLRVRRTGEVVLPRALQAPSAPAALLFDDARNWTLVEALLRDPDARVQYVFVARHLRDRLLDEARRRGAPAWLVARAERVLLQPTHGNPHHDHFHVRVYCADRDRGVCRDKEPYWPWVPGLGPVPFSMRDTRDWVAD
jgi:penicillin-insensitive murein endopeptidase